ncbi:MAG: hypothetical protein ACYCUY_02875 [Acidithiobacillus sp.]
MIGKNNRPWLYMAVACGVVAGLSGCQGVNGALASVNNGLAQADTALGAPAGVAGGPLNTGAPISPAMMQQADSMVLQSAQSEGNKSLANAVQQAAPAVQAVLKSFASGVGCNGTEMYALPGNYTCLVFPGWPANAPQNVPLNVQSVGNWRVITANSFSFSTNLCSPISQTCITVTPTFINMGDGWQIESIG